MTYTADMTDLRARLVILAGLPGAGKTTMATWLRDEFGFCVASRDVIRAAMFPKCRFTAAEKDSAYEAMKASIKVMLGQGYDVVTDGMCFSSADQVEEVRQLALSVGASIDIIECACPISVAQKRVESDRRTDPTVPGDRDAGLVQVVADRFETLPLGTIRIDTSAERDAIREQVVEALRLHHSA
jgi:predicted kinase